VIPLQGYKTGTWYPFHKLGKINDPKTTAAVGAMLCQLGQGRLPNFYFRSNAFKPYSTVKYIGRMDENGIIKKNNIYYSEVDLDNPDYTFPDISFEMRGPFQLGFRQFNIERWSASPIYILSFRNKMAGKKLYEAGEPCRIELGQEKKSRNENFDIKHVKADSVSIRPKDIKLQFNTLTRMGISESSHYWLDSGSVYR
jgi:hypothetical protein